MKNQQSTIEYKVTVQENGTIEYFNWQGQRHREDGPEGSLPAIERADGSKEYYQNDKLHRVNGPEGSLPAVECSDGSKFYYQNGLLYREDGPAIEYPDGTKVSYLNGKYLTEQEFLERTQVQELSLQDISDKLGIPLHLLKIV